jgi:hypothetical protein
MKKPPDAVPAFAEFMEEISNLTKAASDSLALAKARQERNANRTRRDLSFKVGEQVLLSATNIRLASQVKQPSKKLQARFIGPYRIIEEVSPVAYRLELPPTMKIHPVFHVSLLKQYHKPDKVPDREVPPAPPDPITIDEREEFEVEKILDRRTRYRRVEYLVKWMGYPDHDASWEPAKNLNNAKEAIAEFERSNVEGDI